MNHIKFFIVSIHRDYIVRFHANAEGIVMDYQKRYPGYQFHVKKIEAYLFCFSIVPPEEETDTTQTDACLKQLKEDVSKLIPSEYFRMEAAN